MILNPDQLSDNYAFQSLKKEQTTDQIVELYSSFRGKEEFSAKVITNGPDADTSVIGFRTWVKFRTEIQEGCLPDPCDPSLSQEEIKKIISCHPTSVSIRPFGEADQPPRYGQTVLINYVENGPNNNGLQRDPRFVPEHKLVKYNYQCVAGELTGLRSFSSGLQQTLMQDVPLNSPPELDQTSTPNQLISSVTSDDTVFLFGDSQMQPSTKGGDTVGKTLEKTFKKDRTADQAKKVTRVGNGGWTPKKYVTNFNSQLKSNIEKKPKLIVIVLGGNGVHPKAKHALTLLEKIRAISPTSQIIWIGPPPPASDGTTYNKDGKLLKSRKDKNKILQDNISSKVSKFINSYEVSGYESGYSCSGTCDGVHMPGDYAKTFLNNAGMLKT